MSIPPFRNPPAPPRIEVTGYSDRQRRFAQAGIAVPFSSDNMTPEEVAAWRLGDLARKLRLHDGNHVEQYRIRCEMRRYEKVIARAEHAEWCDRRLSLWRCAWLAIRAYMGSEVAHRQLVGAPEKALPNPWAMTELQPMSRVELIAHTVEFDKQRDVIRFRNDPLWHSLAA